MLRMSLSGFASVSAMAAGFGLGAPSSARADDFSFGFSYGPRYVSPAPVVFSTPTYVSYAPSYPRCTSSYSGYAANVYSPSTYYAPAPAVYEPPVYYERPVVVSSPVYAQPYYASSGFGFGFAYGGYGRCGNSSYYGRPAYSGYYGRPAYPVQYSRPGSGYYGRPAYPAHYGRPGNSGNSGYYGRPGNAGHSGHRPSNTGGFSGRGRR